MARNHAKNISIAFRSFIGLIFPEKTKKWCRKIFEEVTGFGRVLSPPIPVRIITQIIMILNVILSINHHRRLIAMVLKETVAKIITRLLKRTNTTIKIMMIAVVAILIAVLLLNLIVQLTKEVVLTIILIMRNNIQDHQLL